MTNTHVALLTLVVLVAVIIFHTRRNRVFKVKLITSKDCPKYLHWYVSRNFKGGKLTNYEGKLVDGQWHWYLWVKL